MSVYYQIIIWLAVFGILSYIVPVYRTEYVLGKKVNRVIPVYAILAVCPLIYYTMNRDIAVGDTYVYKQSFEAIPAGFSNIFSYVNTIDKDKGFSFLSAIIRNVVGTDARIYFLILAIVQAGILVITYRKYSTSFLLSLFLFLASTDYISWMFNGIRQFTAVTITFSACTLILKKKYVPAIIIILLAATIHQTALLVIPFVFVVQGKAWNKKTLLFIVAVILIVAFIGQFTNVLDTMLQETQYKNVVSDWKEWGDDGTNILRVLVYSVPSILSLIGLRFVKEADDPIINMSVNMSIISSGLYVVSMFTSGIFIGRLPIYFSLYNYILLPWEMNYMFTKRSALLVKMLMLLIYLAFYYIGMSGWGLI